MTSWLTSMDLKKARGGDGIRASRDDVIKQDSHGAIAREMATKSDVVLGKRGMRL